jgi:hypothetical protein
MASLRLWIVAVAVGCFAAGMVVGNVIGERSGVVESEPLFDLAYAEQLVADYRLDAEQSRSLRIVLQAERAEEKAIRLAIAWTELPEPLQRKLLAARAKTGKRIRALLNPEQRLAYDRDSLPIGARPNDAGHEAGRK